MVKFNDLSDRQKTSKQERFDILSEEIDANVAGDATISGRVETLETAVGNDTSGLVHDVDDIQDYIAEIITANNLTDPRAETAPDNGET